MKFATAVFHSPLRYATQNHRIGAINHQSLFHNELGMEKLLVTLKRKIIHAMATKVHSEGILRKLYLAQNPHQVGQFFTDKFFRAQWQRQRDFEINRNQADWEKKEEQAQFLERGEALKSLAPSISPLPLSHSYQFLLLFMVLNMMKFVAKISTHSKVLKWALMYSQRFGVDFVHSKVFGVGDGLLQNLEWMNWPLQ
ncbi:hypothetical protein PSTG_10960 [Puccinia striiformis f. sp. tritici PST-78]|uniref:Uncharacterized protein n=1 Tax=Puccinia striiformis f. sp. tritici PST-78 TaxID=1165861 RepID=A0A0L0V9S5_9BASI|nr:hypothetical protein PSTG_10960 [Puccinia striiformis f. sp. tritici PST-78]